MEKALELSQALRSSRVYPGPAVFDFLKKKGVTADDIQARGGWLQILMDMIPKEYATVNELIQAIKTP